MDKEQAVAGACVLIALLLLVLFLPNASTATQLAGPTCEERGGHWGFERGVGIGCFTPGGSLLWFAHD